MDNVLWYVMTMKNEVKNEVKNEEIRKTWLYLLIRQ